MKKPTTTKKLTRSPAPEHRIVGLHWSDHQRPTNEIPYDHIIAETPFGRVLITWKGWKEHDTPTIDEFPGVGFLSPGWDIDNAKSIAESEWLRRVSLCLLPNAPDQPTGASAPGQAQTNPDARSAASGCIQQGGDR